MDKRQTVKIISTLFSAYGQANDGNRIAVYTEMLADMPPALLQASCEKLKRRSQRRPRQELGRSTERDSGRHNAYMV